ncbi:MAG: hypothetical protein FWF69_04830 [Firmicutes bacterium]|nr:hypothetical protein [Bacillota bacterium]
MKIAMINGSPKLGQNNSGIMLKLFEPFIQAAHEIAQYTISKEPLTQEQYLALLGADALLFAFPLYVEAIPSHLLRMMTALEKHAKREKKQGLYVYFIINNGFYEGTQNRIAVEVLENWCARCGFRFGMAVCQGAGEMMPAVESMPMGHGPLKNLGKAMKSLAEAIDNKSCGEAIFISPNWPRFMWKFQSHLFWRNAAKKNGLNKADIGKLMDNQHAAD